MKTYIPAATAVAICVAIWWGLYVLDEALPAFASQSAHVGHGRSGGSWSGAWTVLSMVTGPAAGLLWWARRGR